MNNITCDIKTVGYYDANAANFVAGTVGADMSAALERFTALLPAGASVLDWGCGSGRDAKVLAQAGFAVTAVDASVAMCTATAKAANAQVRNQGFLDLADEQAYDGIWACASLLHAHRSDLSRAFELANKALKPNGILYASFKLGSFEGYRNGRWFTDLTEADVPDLVPAEAWQVEAIWQSTDVREGRGDQLWLNFLARKA